MTPNKFSFRDLPDLIQQTYKEWNDDDPWRQSAVVAYYAIFSLPALLIIVITIAGSIFGEDAVQGKVSDEISSMVGPDAAQQVEVMLSNAYQKSNSTIATIVGVATLLFGATGVFYQLQQSLNNVWDVEPKKDAGIKKLLQDRVSSFGIILVIGFLLLISLLLTTALTALSDYIMQYLPEYLLYVFYVAQFVLSFGIITLLFAMIFKILPDVDMGWRTVWIGAAVTAFLFIIGKFALGIYFGKSDPGSAYGAAGSLILILLWTSYSCLILFFGAEFTQVYARKYGHPIQTSGHSKLKEDARERSKELVQERDKHKNKRNKGTHTHTATSREKVHGPEIIHVKRPQQRQS